MEAMQLVADPPPGEDKANVYNEQAEKLGRLVATSLNHVRSIINGILLKVEGFHQSKSWHLPDRWDP